jgi:TonB family protein
MGTPKIIHDGPNLSLIRTGSADKIPSIGEVRLNLDFRQGTEKRRKAIILFLGLSLFLHALIVLTVGYVRTADETRVPPAVYVDLDTLPPAKPTVATPEQKQNPKQIAESEEAPDQTPPKDAKYLGERSQNVEQETKAAKVDTFRKGGKAAQAGNQGKTLSFKDLAPRTNVLTPPTPKELDGYRVEREKQALANAGRPGSQALDNAGSATNDYLKDLKDGDRTLLATKEFQYFGYYRRIRQKLEGAWNSRLRTTLDGYVYGGRQLANNRDYVTGLVVVLDRNGNITRVQVIEQSGARELDQAAIDAFNQAGPFPDPPSGLIDEKGEIQIPWNFVLQS